METNQTTEQSIPILDVAWRRYAELDVHSGELSKGFFRIRRWVAILGVLATVLAIVTDAYSDQLAAILALVLKFFLVLMPIAASVLAAFGNKFHSGRGWLTLRAGAEEILKEIYIYRTVLKNSYARRSWLENRLAAIQRQVYRGLGGELVIKPYKGQIPPRYDPDNPNSDPGFHDLSGEEYFRFRLQDQLAWHIGRVNKSQRARTRLQFFILAAGGAGALLAALGGELTVWVAFTAAIAAALTGWNELRNLDATVQNYSKVIVELMIINDHWENLEPEERTDAEFFKIVRSTEDILWSQNAEYIKAMQEALAEADGEEADLVESMVRVSVEADARMKQQMRDGLVTYADEQLEVVTESAVETYDEALGTLAEEAASEEVAADMRAAGEAVKRMAGAFNAQIEAVKEKYAHVEVTKETDKELLNEILSQYPPTGELKG